MNCNTNNCKQTTVALGNSRNHKVFFLNMNQRNRRRYNYKTAWTGVYGNSV